MLGAEPWTTQLRDQIEQRLNIDAVDIYGLSEVMGPGVANECVETKDGPHIWEDHFLPETIDSTTGAPMADGELGELVFTSLTKEAFPVIRYRTHDLTRLLPGTARPGMRRMQKVTGRDDDMIILRGVNLFPTQIEELVLGIEALTPHFILELTKNGHLDAMTIRIERDPALDVGVCEAAAVVLKQRVKGRIGTTVDIHLEEPGSLPRSQGKYQRVYDLR
ncbi:hypothetical protein GCM10022240_08480 [Microbacterium kribbense]|uniref:AMP-dependent ligase C-terminal domain-containing protein n=1 Tax=Microbacterium kribbense TaxID=433645 RepID=A0ABP7G8N2_9MICO